MRDTHSPAPSSGTGNANSSGFLSNVFGFLSREVESFVASATGGTVQPHTHATHFSNIAAGRKHARGSAREKRRMKPTSSSGRRPRTTSTDNVHGPKRHNSDDASSHPRKRAPSPTKENKDYNRLGTIGEDDSTPTQSSMPPPPVPQNKRSFAFTMPGSLFPRSASLMPDTPVQTPRTEDIDDPRRAVHFTPKEYRPNSEAGPPRSAPIKLTPTRIKSVKDAASHFREDPEEANYSIMFPQHPSISPTSSPSRRSNIGRDVSSSPEKLRNFRAGAPTPESTRKVHAKSPEREASGSDDEDEDEASEEEEEEGEGETRGEETEVTVQRAKLQEAEVDSKPVEQATSKNLSPELRKATVSPPPAPVPSQKGKGRAVEILDEDQLDPNASGVIRMRGKERELDEAREEHRRRELEREEEGYNTSGEAEQNDDKEKIRMLEEEVAALKAELARRPTLLQARTDAILMQALPPPAPPPPPPPPPPLFTADELRQHATSGTEALISTVKARLKHQTPKEAPINIPGIGAPGRAKRLGQPAVNLSGDKMDAFLSEMKSVRLRRVEDAQQASTSHAAPPPPPRRMTLDNLAIRRLPIDTSSADMSFNVGNMTTGAIDIGRKRKFGVIDVDEDANAPSKRRYAAMTPSGLNASMSIDNVRQGIVRVPSRVPLPTQVRKLPTQRIYPLPPKLPPAKSASMTSTDVTTPSLCSENEEEAEKETPSEHYPSTPPPELEQQRQTQDQALGDVSAFGINMGNFSEHVVPIGEPLSPVIHSDELDGRILPDDLLSKRPSPVQSSFQDQPRKSRVQERRPTPVPTGIGEEYESEEEDGETDAEEQKETAVSAQRSNGVGNESIRLRNASPESSPQHINGRRHSPIPALDFTGESLRNLRDADTGRDLSKATSSVIPTQRNRTVSAMKVDDPPTQLAPNSTKPAFNSTKPPPTKMVKPSSSLATLQSKSSITFTKPSSSITSAKPVSKPSSTVPTKLPTKTLSRIPTRAPAPAPVAGPSKPKPRRRPTLDEELLLAEGVLPLDGDVRGGSGGADEEEARDDELVGYGTRNTQRGFLAHGGGGGPAVFMGPGYVHGAVESEDEEEPWMPRGMKRSMSIGAARG